MPMPSVTAKSRTGPVPMKNSTAAAMNVVMLESRMVAKARVKPASIALIGDRELGRQCTGAQQNGEIVCRLDGKVAGDLSSAAQDRLADDGSGNDLLVEHDGERTSDILLGHLGKLARARRIELE